MRTGILESLRPMPGKTLVGRDAAKGTLIFPQYILFFVLAVVVPVIVTFSLEVWMITAYTSALSMPAFVGQYSTGIYRYRILGREIVLHLYYWFKPHIVDRAYPTLRDPKASFLLYATLSSLNAVYFSLSNLLLLSLLWIKNRGLTDRDLVGYFYYTLFAVMSMAVVTPYDQLAYLLLLLGVFAADVKNTYVSCLMVGLSSVAGSLNRETEFLLASFFAGLALCSQKRYARRYWVLWAINVTLSLGSYLAVRAFSPGRWNFIQDVTFGGKWAAESLLIIALILSGTVVIALRIYHDLRPVVVVLVFSSPYFLAVSVGGVFRELRLTVPVILILLCTYVFLSRAADADKSGCNQIDVLQ